MTGKGETSKLIVANCSGFFGDKITAAREMIEGGPIDVITGDYLAELTMAILLKRRLKNPKGGYASTFLIQMEDIMALCLDQQIKVVVNAGGLDPRGMAKDLQLIADKLGLYPKIAFIEGDDLLPRLAELQEKGESFSHLDKKIPLQEAKAKTLTANAYLGGWGITQALQQGADIVIGGRIADASLVVGPAAWKFDWQRNDWDKLAGAVVAGHIIECSNQATGGNYSFFEEIPSFKNVGFPIAEIYPDGSSVITKHPGTGGMVSVGTVTAQLLYEIKGPGYLTPDVVARFDTISITQAGPDQVAIKDVKGEPPTATSKVCINNIGGYKNSMTILLTGLDVAKKAKLCEEILFDSLGGKERFEEVNVHLFRSDQPDPVRNEDAIAYLRIAVKDKDPTLVGREFLSRVNELFLSSIPGFSLSAQPAKASPTISHWPALVNNKHIHPIMVMDGKETAISITLPDSNFALPAPKEVALPAIQTGKTVSAPLGRLFAARSGDKGGNANLGIWGKNSQTFSFLKQFLTIEKIKELLPDLQEYEIERYELCNLLALNFFIKGFLGNGVADSIKSDPQAKTLGEYLRAKIVALPEAIL